MPLEGFSTKKKIEQVPERQRFIVAGGLRPRRDLLSRLSNPMVYWLRVECVASSVTPDKFG